MTVATVPTVTTMTTDQLAAELQERVRALYRLNAELAAQCDRLGKVVDAVLPWEYTLRLTPAADAIKEYREQMAQLAKEGGDGRGNG